MKPTINFILFLLTLTIISCKKEQKFSEFTFAEKGNVIKCEDKNIDIINEALFSFEDDIASFYAVNGNKNLTNAYSQFLRASTAKRVNYTDIISPHSVKVFEALKTVNKLWDANNANSYLNYNSDLLSCISSSFMNQNLKTTYSALVTTNSMKPELFVSPIAKNYRLLISDKHLATYVALDLFYAKLFGLDLSNVKEKPVVKQKVDFNKRPIAK